MRNKRNVSAESWPEFALIVTLVTSVTHMGLAVRARTTFDAMGEPIGLPSPMPERSMRSLSTRAQKKAHSKIDVRLTPPNVRWGSQRYNQKGPSKGCFTCLRLAGIGSWICRQQRYG